MGTERVMYGTCRGHANTNFVFELPKGVVVPGVYNEIICRDIRLDTMTLEHFQL
jgi:hypothetical protein